MKKVLLLITSMMFLWISSIATAVLYPIENFFQNKTPLWNDSYQKLLNNYDTTRWYSDNITIECENNDNISIVSPIIEDGIFDRVTYYRLIISPYHISEIKDGNKSVDISKIKIKDINIDNDAYEVNFNILNSELENNSDYYATIVPIDIYDFIWTPSWEINIKTSKNICTYTKQNTAKTITLRPWLNTFSTPAIIKSISFSNGWSNISFAKMEKWERKAMTVNNSNVRTIVKPLEWYIIRNSNTNDVTMTIEYDTDNSDSLTLSKNLNAWWNFLWITTTNNPFNNIASTTATMILDLTNWWDTNLIQLGKTFIQATRFTLWKAYAVFVNNSWTYGWINNYGDDDEELFKSCRLNPDVLCQLDDQWHLLTPETCPSYCLREELINNISESVEYTKGESSEKEVFNWYFKSKKWTIWIDKISIFCWYEEGFCFNNMIFYLNIGQSNYIINNQGSLTLNNISVEENKSIPISIYAYTNNSNFESIWKYTYYLRLNLSNWDEESIRLIPMYVKNPGWQTYENRLVYWYERAYENWIIPEWNIDDAGLYNTLSNASMKTILLNFASNLWLNSNSTLELFSDLLADEESPTNRANFGTALSRILRWDKYDGGNPYYTNHLNALKTAGIMNQIDNPTETLEIKWYVLAMLMEASRIYSVDCNDPLVVLACSDPENYYYESCPVRCRNNIYQYTDELVEAYNWAYENWIISESNIEDAYLYDKLPDPLLKTMLLNFAYYLWFNKTTITDLFGDLLDDEGSYANRAEFGTALSRILWWDSYDGWTPYYINHLNALKAAGIMDKIDDPAALSAFKWFI